MEQIKIVQHNIVKWTYNRRNELYNIYAKENPDIIILNSTGIPDTERIKMYTYKTYQKNKEGEEHAGVAIAIKQNIKHRIIDDYDADVRAIEIETARGPIQIATTYWPPRRDEIPYQEIINTARKPLPVYFLGDFNARHPFIGHRTSNNRGRFLNTLINNNILNYIGPEFSTLVHHGGISKPDIILTNRNCHLNFSIKKGPLTTSDHIPIIFTIATKPIVEELRETYQISKTNWDNFKETMEQITIETEANHGQEPLQIDQNYIDSEIESWHQIITQTKEKVTPKKFIKLVPHAKDSDLLKLYQRNYREIQRTIEGTGMTAEIRYQIRNIQDNIKIESIRINNEFWDNKISEMDINYNNPKKFWRDIKLLQGGKEGPNPYLIDGNGRKIKDKVGKEELLRETWSKTFKISNEENLAFDATHEATINNYLRDNGYRIKPYQYANLNRLDENNFLTKPIKSVDIKQIIKSFKNKAPGESQVNKLLLSNITDKMIDKFKYILNLSLSMGYYPMYFKSGILCLINKPGKDPHRPENYRPITLLEVAGKIFEKIINERIKKHLEDNNCFHKHQYGFRKNRGTEIALATIYETVALSQREKYQCNIVCRDVTKAFDKVWIAGLQYKIMQLILPDIIEKITCNFLVDRKAKIRFEGYMGPQFQLESGVPQGAILSPTLYILYTADLPTSREGTLDVLFADDITQIIICPNPSKRLMAIKTAREIERVNTYERKWKIKTNQQKFKLLSISKHKPSEVIVNNQVIPFAREINTLGLTIKRTGMLWHNKQRLNMAKGTKTKLKRFKNLRSKIKIHLYKSLILSALEYPNVPTCIMAKTEKERIQLFQNGIIRQYTRNNEDDFDLTIEDLHEKYKIEAINVRMYGRAQKTWNKLRSINEELVERTEATDNENDTRDHYWWRRISPYVNSDAPNPWFG